MAPLDLDTVRTRLSARTPRVVADGSHGRAAVAAVLRPSAAGPEVLLIRRAERPGDPWSGHMAFPGGRAHPDDREALDTAIRETREEVGLDLRRDAALLGRLDDLPAVARGRPFGLVIAPFVFGTEGDVGLTPNHEVAATAWAPLEALAAASSATTIEYVWEGRTITLPGLRVGADVVWGLTLQMLSALFDVLGLR
jgi:8-oxo-dGTP pyrophosphatase MutT (NUDIX family)